jgi:glycosyltransferase involved in cell wall biosynthesis
VYGRSNNVKVRSGIYRGVHTVVLPTIPTKHLDTVAHTFLSVFHALFARYDAILMCNGVNAIFTIVPQLGGTPVALNVDGIERLRKKWGPLARAVYRISEILAARLPSVVVTDAAVISAYFRDKRGTDSEMISYGADCDRVETTAVIGALGLEPRNYILYVSRLERENNAHVVIEAFGQVATEKRLVIVGDAPYAAAYIAGLKARADRRVVFTGAVYGEGYRELRSHAYAYVQATEVGGTHPALLEAMAAGNCVLARDTPEHREVLRDAGLYYTDATGLADLMVRVLGDESLAVRLGERNMSRIAQDYSWEGVTDKYESLFRRMAGGK